MMKDTIILGIESSCDETSVAVVKNGREVLSNIINSQIKVHELYGGVVPEIASRMHVEAINLITKEAVQKANCTLKDIDAIAVTQGPGLVGALLVGVSYAKGLSLAIQKPLIAVNHIEGHIAGNYLTYKQLKPPFLCLIISGGHTHLVNVKTYTEFEILGKTRDDAIGEAFDKVARVVGLGYPGGPKVEKLAKEGEANIELPVTHLDNYDFSFSGIKTKVINLNHNNKYINKSNLCASFQKAVTEMLLYNVRKAVKDFKVDKICLAGGVSCNSYIRGAFDELSSKLNIKVYYPEPVFCTDNGAMIASMGYYNYINGKKADLNLNAIPNLKIGE
ncbi:MAG: tRNA (adenosine(37)-N6)-threonylcarbamoyltransferase complex transferase subunit TsaD [Clostridia bacterium]|nr:tRNA (adenosine(37)-N6)-threonylcarbamoyltransferase complex transferase subunit TsaD [Clostridia bacterium]